MTEALFPLYGGRPSLDLVATLGKRHADPVERLPSDDALATWMTLSGVLPADLAATPAAPGQLRDARDLREALNRLVRARMADQPLLAPDIALVNKTAARPDVAPQIVDGPTQGVTTGGHPFDAALSTVARDAIDLLTGPRADRVKECEHPDCSLLFLDDSQSGNRRWCSMERCGNLAKISGYRTRRRGGG
jgi:predicted RNA-binding Zn ribbon-like protein